MAVPIQVHPTHTFCRHVEVLAETEGPDDDEDFHTDLVNALVTLKQSDWDEAFKPHGHSGHDFSYPINDKLVLVFRIETDRDGQGRPLLVHRYLKTIEIVR